MMQKEFMAGQGLETNEICWNTAIECNNNNDSFIFSRAHLNSVARLRNYTLKSGFH